MSALKIPPMPPVHPAAELFPMMSDDELRALAADIKANGLQQPVIMFGAQLLDGRNRWRACEIAGVEPRLRDWNGKDAVAYVRSLNLHRRHLTAAQRAALAVKAEPVFAEKAAERQKEAASRGGKSKGVGGNRPDLPPKRALAEAAKTTGASLDSAKAMKQVAQRAPEVVDLVQRGQVETVADARRIADVEPDKRAAVVELVRDSGFSVSSALAEVRAERATPVGQLAAAVEAVRKHAVAARGAAERLEEVCRRERASIASPDLGLAATALLQARSEITRAIDMLRADKDQ